MVWLAHDLLTYGGLDLREGGCGPNRLTAEPALGIAAP